MSDDSNDRASQPGWRKIIDPDKSGRRAVWFRRAGEALEICGGREGDDDYVLLERVSVDQERRLSGLFATARWVGEFADDTDTDRDADQAAVKSPPVIRFEVYRQVEIDGLTRAQFLYTLDAKYAVDGVLVEGAKDRIRAELLSASGPGIYEVIARRGLVRILPLSFPLVVEA